MHQKMYVKALMLYLLAMAWITAAYKPPNFSDMKADSDEGSGSSIFLPITGNVYPKGFYTVNITVGNDNPPKFYVLDVDTGSDLTWARNTISPGQDPNSVIGAVVSCDDDACKALGDLGYANNCQSPQDQCEYRVYYADGGSSTGVLVKDSIPLTLSNGTIVAPQLAFGRWVLPQEDLDPVHQPINNGILGLGKGEPGILQQLSNMGVIPNVVGHCLSGQGEVGGGGYLFFGDIQVSGVAWKKISSDFEHYYLGSANILLDGEATDITGLGIIFDSGSTFTYLASEAYGALLDLVTKNLNLTIADVDPALPICWQGPFQTIVDASEHFKTVALNFVDEDSNVLFEMPPESYLIISEMQNACLGILNGTEVGLKDMNLIGDISMQNKLVIYDNENGFVGWAAVDSCIRN